MKDTASEVQAIQRVAQARLNALAEHLHTWVINPAWLAIGCHVTLGFYKPHNRSPKPLARLKHSLTALTLKQLQL